MATGKINGLARKPQLSIDFEQESFFEAGEKLEAKQRPRLDETGSFFLRNFPTPPHTRWCPFDMFSNAILFAYEKKRCQMSRF